MGHELYQVFSEGTDGSLVVEDFDNYYDFAVGTRDEESFEVII